MRPALLLRLLGRFTLLQCARLSERTSCKVSISAYARIAEPHLTLLLRSSAGASCTRHRLLQHRRQKPSLVVSPPQASLCLALKSCAAPSPRPRRFMDSLEHAHPSWSQQCDMLLPKVQPSMVRSTHQTSNVQNRAMQTRPREV